MMLWTDIEKKRFSGFDTLICKCSMLGFTHDFHTGYVRIPKGHPWYNLHYDELQTNYEISEELTFSGELHGRSGFWVGFDHAHYGQENYGILEARSGVVELAEAAKLAKGT